MLYIKSTLLLAAVRVLSVPTSIDHTSTLTPTTSASFSTTPTVLTTSQKSQEALPSSEAPPHLLAARHWKPAIGSSIWRQEMYEDELYSQERANEYRIKQEQEKKRREKELREKRLEEERRKERELQEERLRQKKLQEERLEQERREKLRLEDEERKKTESLEMLNDQEAVADETAMVPTLSSVTDAIKMTRYYLEVLPNKYRLPLKVLIHNNRDTAYKLTTSHRQAIRKELRKWQAELQPEIEHKKPLDETISLQTYAIDVMMRMQRFNESALAKDQKQAIQSIMDAQQQAEAQLSKDDTIASDEKRHRRYAEHRLAGLHKGLLAAVEQENRLKKRLLADEHAQVLDNFADKQQRAARRYSTDKLIYFPNCSRVDEFGRAQWLYRVDTRSPDIIRADGGFYPEYWYQGMNIANEDVSLKKHVRGLAQVGQDDDNVSDKGGYVAMTCSAEEAKETAYSMLQRGAPRGLFQVWIYVVAPTPSSINLSKTLRGNSSDTSSGDSNSHDKPLPDGVKSHAVYANLGPVEYDRIVFHSRFHSVEMTPETSTTTVEYQVEQSNDKLNYDFDTRRYAHITVAEEEASLLAAVLELIRNDDQEPLTCITINLSPDASPEGIRVNLYNLLRQRKVPAARCNDFKPTTYRWVKYMVETLGQGAKGEEHAMVELFRSPSSASPLPESKSEPELESKTESESESKSESELGRVPVEGWESEPGSGPESELEPKSVLESRSESESDSELESDLESGWGPVLASEPEPELDSESELGWGPVLESKSESESKPESKSESQQQQPLCLSIASDVFDVEHYSEVSWATCDTHDPDQMWVYVSSTGRLQHAYRHLCVVKQPWHDSSSSSSSGTQGNDAHGKRVVPWPCFWDEPMQQQQHWTLRKTTGALASSIDDGRIVLPPSSGNKVGGGKSGLLHSAGQTEFSWHLKRNPDDRWPRW